MKLSTYPKLNLPTVRLGVEIGDWFWVCAIPAVFGLAFRSLITGAILLAITYALAAFVKPKFREGYFKAWWDFNNSGHLFFADLEKKVAAGSSPQKK